jgi:glycosyltransferase involved in cell wall biosynthesis
VSTTERAHPPLGFLRVLVVFHESDALGAGKSVLRALDPLAKYGWTAQAWFPGEGPLLEESRVSAAFHSSSDKPIRYSVRGWRADPGVVARLRETPSYLRRFREALLRARPHVVHANTLRTLPEARVARSLGLPVVIHVHELPRPGVKRAVVIRAAARTADAFVAVSEAVADVIRPYAGLTPVLVAYNGMPESPLQKLSAASDIVGTIGTICRTKGTDIFLEAAVLARKHRAELRFEHVGQSGLDEDAEFERGISRLASSADVRAAVTLLGRRPAAETLGRWEIFVLASRQDAFPLATLEAMAAGVPVIATRVGGVPEQIDHLVSGVLVEPDDPRALADWIIRLHDDPNLRRTLADGALNSVRRFTVEGQAAVFHEAYLAALNLRHGPPAVRARTLEVV